MRNPEDYKETYKLWVDYLKESSEYRNCRDANAFRPVKTVEEIYRDGIEKSISMSKGRNRLITIERMYDVFGDIFVDLDDPSRFEKWWNGRMLPLLRLNESPPDCIKNSGQDILRCAEEIYALFAQGDQGVTVEEIGNLLNRRLGERPGIIPLQVFAYYSPTTLQERLNQIIEEHKGLYPLPSRKGRKFINLLVPRPYPKRLSKPEVKALKKYLQIYRVYRVKKASGGTFIDVVEELEKEHAFDQDGVFKEHLRTDYVTHNRFALTLIKNAAKGIFPGEYRLKKKKINNHR